MRVLLTGASGFIGARLAECLTSASGAEVHALVRRLGTVGTARLARLSGIRIFTGDVRNSESVDRAAAGCSHAIHCAAATSGSPRDQRDTELRGIHHVLETARRHRLQRVVYLSSAAVHDPSRSSERIDEGSPLNGRSAYARAKIEAEAWLSRHGQGWGLPVVMLRPTAVWGPCSPNWTVAAAQLIDKGVAFLPHQGQGTANVVYVDNLVDAVCLALTRPEAIGQVFLVNDDEPLTWRQLYSGYANYLGRPLLTTADPPGLSEMLRISGHNAGLLLRSVLRGQAPRDIRLLRQAYTHVPLAKHVIGALPDFLKQSIKRQIAGRELVADGSGTSSAAPAEFLPYPFMPAPTRKLYGAMARYANEALKQRLGWAPRISFEQGLARTCEWLRYAGYAA